MNKIRKFTENLEALSSDAINEINTKLEGDIYSINVMMESYESIIKSLDRYRDIESDKSDQLDEVVNNLNFSKTSLEETKLKLLENIELLRDYSNSGRNFLF